MHQVLRIARKWFEVVLELLHILLVFVLPAELHLGLSVLFEEHDLQNLQEMTVVRAEKFPIPIKSSSSPFATDIAFVPLPSGPTLGS